MKAALCMVTGTTSENSVDDVRRITNVVLFVVLKRKMVKHDNHRASKPLVREPNNTQTSESKAHTILFQSVMFISPDLNDH